MIARGMFVTTSDHAEPAARASSDRKLLVDVLLRRTFTSSSRGAR